MRWQRTGLMPAQGEDRRMTKEKTAWAGESQCLKWCVGFRAGESQYSSHLTTHDVTNSD